MTQRQLMTPREEELGEEVARELERPSDSLGP